MTVSATTTSVQLLGGFRVCVATQVLPFPLAAQRVIAFIALRGRPVHRATIARELWPGSAELGAARCLRSCLWRLDLKEAGLIGRADNRLQLRPDVSVDVLDQLDSARSVIQGRVTDGVPAQLLDDDELLPDWQDAWIGVERMRVEELRSQALEHLVKAHLQSGRHSDALDLLLRLLRTQPLRESANRLLIEAHLAQGNRERALRHYNAFCDLLARRARLDPPPDLAAFVEALRR